jgi:hypothetical protein
MFRWHPETPNRVTLKIEFDHHGGLGSDYPAVMPRFDRHRLRRGEFESASVGILNVDLSACEEANVRVPAEISAYDHFHVARPAESRWIDYPLYPAITRAGNVYLDASNLAVVGSIHRGGQWIERHLRSPPIVRYYFSHRSIVAFRLQGRVALQHPRGKLWAACQPL